jgi:hypothetical protein
MGRGVWVEIGTADTDVTVLTVPVGRIGKVSRIEVRNAGASDARVRLWDTFTDYAETSYRSQKADYTIANGTSVVLDVESKQVLGTLVAQSDVVPVQLYVECELE